MRNRKRSRGLTLLEMVVSMALVSAMGIFILRLYISAQTEFDHTSGTINMAQHVRKITSKMIPLLTSSIPYPQIDDSGVLIPPSGGSSLDEYYECDFLCSKYVVRDPRPSRHASWNSTQGFWLDPVFADRVTYEPDDVNGSAEVRREPSIYRYRFLWRPYKVWEAGNRVDEIAYENKGFPRRSVVFERLESSGGPGGANDFNNRIPGYPMSKTPNPNRIPLVDTSRRVVAHKVSLMTVQRDGNALQLRIRIYNVDPEVWEDAVRLDSQALRYEAALDGSFMRGLDRKTRFRAYDVTTSIHLPSSTI